MKIVGLTGSIGMGKSTVAAMLRDLGVPVFDADAEVHRLQGPGGALVDAIETAFPDTTGPAGVDRQKLGARVLGDDAAMKRLEGIVHPAVGEARRRFLADNADASFVVFDIPLLFEKGGEASVSAVWVVSAPLDVQRTRVLARPGMSAEKFDSILARQMPDDEKRRRATSIIDTGQSLDVTRAQVVALVACIRASEGQ
ncbi:MAG: dephospho-CoA kinase [Pseudomonadota bacterium]